MTQAEKLSFTLRDRSANVYVLDRVTNGTWRLTNRVGFSMDFSYICPDRTRLPGLRNGLASSSDPATLLRLIQVHCPSFTVTVTA